jgi:hypothetical protein
MAKCFAVAAKLITIPVIACGNASILFFSEETDRTLVPKDAFADLRRIGMRIAFSFPY